MAQRSAGIPRANDGAQGDSMCTRCSGLGTGTSRHGQHYWMRVAAGVQNQETKLVIFATFIFDIIFLIRSGEVQGEERNFAGRTLRAVQPRAHATM